MNNNTHYFVRERIHIDFMQGEPSYTGREGICTFIDDAGQLHGTWGGCAIIPEIDEFHIVKI